MLTLGQQVVIESFAKELIKQIKFVIENKPIKRVSKRYRQPDKVFYAPVSASGNLANTLRYELTDQHLKIFANDYIYELIFGKRPTLSATENDLQLENKIKQWMADKGIRPDNGTSQDTLAYLITRKIRDYGSSIYLASHGQNSGLLNNVLQQTMITDYNAKFTQQLSTEFTQAFLDG